LLHHAAVRPAFQLLATTAYGSVRVEAVTLAENVEAFIVCSACQANIKDASSQWIGLLLIEHIEKIGG